MNGLWKAIVLFSNDTHYSVAKSCDVYYIYWCLWWLSFIYWSITTIIKHKWDTILYAFRWGILGGFIVPFLQKGINNGTIEKEFEPDGQDIIPEFGFNKNIQSCVSSFYKWYGAPYP